MALLLTVVFTATKLNDFNFATTVRHNFSFGLRRHQRKGTPILTSSSVCDHQNFSELDSFASCDVQLFRANGLTFAYWCCFTTTLKPRITKLRFRATTSMIQSAL